MNNRCPRCRKTHEPRANYCPWCGLRLTGGDHAALWSHPAPKAAPAGFQPVLDAFNIYFRWRPEWGDRRLIDTEPVVVEFFNGGYALEEAEFAAELLDTRGRLLRRRPLHSAALPHDTVVEAQLPSYDLDGFADLRLVFIRADLSAATPASTALPPGDSG